LLTLRGDSSEGSQTYDSADKQEQLYVHQRLVTTETTQPKEDNMRKLDVATDMRVRKINDSYQNMLGNILRLISHPETTPDQLQQAREALIHATTTLRNLQLDLFTIGYEFDVVRGITADRRML
jgi:hypothetical protein